MNRRDFVAGATALLALRSFAAWATTRDEIADFYRWNKEFKFRTELRFDWDASSGLLSVYESLSEDEAQQKQFEATIAKLEYTNDSETLTKLWRHVKQQIAWQVDLRPLDPKPVVSLRHIAGTFQQHALTITCHGRQEFARKFWKVKKPARVLRLSFTQSDDRGWQVALDSDFWSHQNTFFSFGSISFQDLAGSAAGSTEAAAFTPVLIPADHVAGALEQLFGQQFLAEGKISVVIDAGLRWSIPRDDAKKGKLLLFGRQLIAQGLSTIAWMVPETAKETKEKNEPLQREQEQRIIARGMASLVGNSIICGDNAAFHVHFTPLSQNPSYLSPVEKQDTDSLASFEVTHSDMENAAQVKVDSASKRWAFYFQEGAFSKAGHASASGSLVRRQIAGGGRRFETEARMVGIGPDPVSYAEIVSRKMSQKPGVKDQAQSQIFNLATFMGNLKVAAVTPTKTTPIQSAVAKKPADTNPKEEKTNGQKTTAQSQDFEDLPAELLVKATDTLTEKPQLADTAALRLFHLKLSLMEAPYGLPDASHSRLLFRSASLSLLYDVADGNQLPTSYVWLDRARPPAAGIARFDLTRAEITAQNDVELLSIAFRFSDLALLFALRKDPNGTEGFSRLPPRIAPLPVECRIIAGAQPATFHDTRPRLIVEFPPQHVFEEALYLPQPEPPPELKVDGLDLTKEFSVDEPSLDKELQNGWIIDPRVLVVQLSRVKRSQRGAIRGRWFSAVEGFVKELPGGERGDPNWDKFNVFRKRFKTFAMGKGVRGDQLEYIGPIGLEPDAAVAARLLAELFRNEQIETITDQLAKAVTASRSRFNPETVLSDMADRRRVEALLEAEHPLYGVFRAKFAEKYYETKLNGAQRPGVSLDEGYKAAEEKFEAKDAEYFPDPKLEPEADLRQRLSESYFVNFMKGTELVPDVVRARLANPSRLVFALNCGPNKHEALELEASDPGSAMDYTLAALTDWSKHELVVVRRAQKLYETDEHGLLGAPNKRVATINDADILTFQGIKPNKFVTSQQRLAEVAAAMRDPPSAVETAIEIPARLILSPSQDAVWTTPHRLDKWSDYYSAVFYPDDPVSQADHQSGLGPRVPPQEIRSLRPRKGNWPLWSTTIDNEAAEPSIRAVHSPDFRPGFFWSRFAAEWQQSPNEPAAFLKMLGNQPPPKGPLAPWYLGRETSEAGTPKPDEVYDALPQLSSNAKSDGDDICKVIESQAAQKKGTAPWFTIPEFIAYLCGRKPLTDSLAEAAIFRSTLDAYDRHELVLLSSAHGLPVQGRRDANNGLMKDSDQFEPPANYRIIDLYDDSAIYRPKALNVRELTLTALGGTFRHDSAFQPPAAAVHMGGLRIYDSLSIERWQHWTVLGRDVFVEVVYKGFLFPLGVKASLVKLTERTFLRNERGFVKAYLRQRMFIRCGNPDKQFPAMRQPNGGRQFPCELLRMLTVTTPDIVDPTTMLGNSAPEVNGLQSQLNGRLKVPNSGKAGLMFWPRTALSSEADILFDFSIDGRKTRLPLIFIDNTAVQDAETVGALVNYYNHMASPDGSNESGVCAFKSINAREHKRSPKFGGQALRYCEEAKVGDCTIETDSWTLKAQGVPHGSTELEGDNTGYTMDAQMQGDDQPAFYPAVQTARIRLKQVERFTGAQVKEVQAQFDGGYIEAGFRNQGDSRAAQNALDVYLNFVTPVPMGMGSNGDRSGGMYNPDNDFVALSRVNGPVGGRSKIVDEKGERESLTIKDCGQLQDWSRHAIGFNTKEKEAPKPDESGEVPALATPSSKLDDFRDKIDVFKNYFSGNAKLLGIIRLDKLIEFLGIDADMNPTELPIVKEVVEYGASAMHKANNATGGMTDFLKTEVLTPLQRIIRELDQQWSDIQIAWNKARNKANDTKGFLDLAKLFPEIGSGLKGLDEAIGEALKAESTLDFALHLSTVYEAGQQLVRGLARLAANPIGRVSEGAQKLLEQYKAIAETALGEVTAFLAALQGDLGVFRVDLLNAMAEEVSDEISARIGSPAALPAMIEKRFFQLETVLGDRNKLSGLADETRAELIQTLQRVKIAASTPLAPDKIKALVRHVLGHLSKEPSPPPTTILDDTDKFRTEVKAFNERVELAVQKILATQLAKMSDWLVESVADSANIETLAEFIAAAQALKSNLLVLAETLAAVVERAKNADPGKPSVVLAASDCLLLVQPYLPAKLSAEVPRLSAMLVRLANVMIALEQQDYKTAIQGALSLLTPLIGTYSLEDIETSAAPLKDAYGQYLEFQKQVLKSVLGAAEAPGKNLETAIAGLNTQIKEYPKLLSEHQALVNNLGTPPEPIRAAVIKYNNSLVELSKQLPSILARWSQVSVLLNKESATLKELREMLKDGEAAPSVFDLLAKDTKPTLYDLRRLAEARLRILSLMAAAATETGSAALSFLNGNKEILAAAAALALSAEQLPDQMDEAAFKKVREAEDLLKTKVAAVGTFAQTVALAGFDAATGLVGFAAGTADQANQRLQAIIGELRRLPLGLGQLIAEDLNGMGLDVLAVETFRVELQKAKNIVLAFKGFKDLASKDLGAHQSALEDFVDALQTAAMIIKAASLALTPFDPNQKLENFVQTLSTKLPLHAESRLQASLERIKTAFHDFATEQADDLKDQLAQKLAGGNVEFNWPGLLHIYGAIQKGRKEIADVLADLPQILVSELSKIVVVPRPDQKDATTDDDQLTTDIAWLELAQAHKASLDAEAEKSMRNFVRGWIDGTASPLLLIKNAERLADLILRGEVYRLIDFSAIRDEVEQRIKQLVPLRATLGYTFGGPFENAGKIKELTAGIFAPEEGSRLDIRTSVKVEFLTPDKPDVNVVGDLGPFSIRLVGDLLDAVTIKFHGARFTIKNGRSPTVDVFYNDFIVGRDLEFVQRLQAYLTPEKGSGYFLKFTTQPLGVEAGYGLALPILTLGTVSFSNISLNASMIIPFDGSDTRFRASLSRIDAPFTISAAPYGGSGYFGIEANGDGVIGFDASFEYGGASAFQFGPMKGIGRLMLGVYIRQSKVSLPADASGNTKSKNLVEIMGTFYVGGTASIWIFNFGASLYVRLGMSGGDMVGDATFTFSFSCGFVDFDYSIRVQRRQKQMGSGGSAFFERPHLIQVTSNDPAAALGSEQDIQPSVAHFKKSRRINDTSCQGVSWKTYRSYFDTSLETTGGFL